MIWQNYHNIVIIGMSGIGKSTVARILAKTLQLDFIDTDREIEIESNLKIKDIFEVLGESYFRDKEIQVIANSVIQQNVVIALGGGSLDRKENVYTLHHNNSLVIYLYGLPNRIFTKKLAKTRPVLQKIMGNREEISKLFTKRDIIYRQVADVIINADTNNSNQLVQKVLSALEIEV